MASVDKLGPYIQQLMATAIDTEDDFARLGMSSKKSQTSGFFLNKMTIKKRRVET